MGRWVYSRGIKTKGLERKLGSKMSKYRVSHIPQVPMKSFNVEVDSVKEAVKVSEILKEYDLFQYENNVKPDYCNMTFIEEWADYGDGYDWYNLEDEEVQELLEQED